jgi:hypothetical protein
VCVFYVSAWMLRGRARFEERALARSLGKREKERVRARERARAPYAIFLRESAREKREQGNCERERAPGLCALLTLMCL